MTQILFTILILAVMISCLSAKSKDVTQKLLISPFTLIGVLIGWAGLFVNKIRHRYCAVKFEHNAINFIACPLMPANAAITLGNCILYGVHFHPRAYGSYGDMNVNIGKHEEAHTYQWQKYSLAFPFLYLALAFKGRSNPFEVAAQNYGRGTGSWKPF